MPWNNKRAEIGQKSEQHTEGKKMQNFKIRDPQGWQPVENAEVLQVDVSQPRNVKQAINATGKVAIYYADNPEMAGAVLVGAASEMFTIEVAMQETGYLTYVAEAGTKIFVKGYTASQARKASQSEAYTSLEPQGRRNSDLDRMMQFVKLNEMTRQRQMREEIAKMRAEMQEEVPLVETDTPPETQTEEETDEVPEAGNTTSTA